MDSLKESVALHLLRFLLYANGFNPAYEARKKKNITNPKIFQLNYLFHI